MSKESSGSASPGSPLEGIRVVDLTEFVFTASVGAILGDWGADVIKIEHPTRGDGARGLLAAGTIPMGTWNFQLELANRNKRSLGLDVSGTEGQAVIHRLVKDSDVFITSLRNSALRKFRIDYDTLSAINPQLVYAHGTGYGEVGEEGERPGYDLAAYWARSGLLSTFMTAEDGEVLMPPLGMGDMSSGLSLAGAVALALLARQRTGIGQHVSLSLLGAATWAGSLPLQAVLATNREYPLFSRKRAANPLWNCYQTKDGKWLVLVCFQSDRYWSSFCKAIDRPDLEHDSRFCCLEHLRANNTELIAILDGLFATRPRDEWGRRFDEHGVIWGPVQTFGEVANDPQVLANNYLIEVPHPTVGRIKLVLNPIRMSAMEPSIKSTAPELGQHTEELLLEMGYTWDEVRRLKDANVIN